MTQKLLLKNVLQPPSKSLSTVEFLFSEIVASRACGELF